VTFFVQKRLALGSIRFGVSVDGASPVIDEDPSLSTGAAGELLLRDRAGFYFADNAPVAGPLLPATRPVSAMPFLESLKPDGTRRGWIFLASQSAGLLFVLLGLAVLVRKGPAGWVEILLGLAMIATPVVLTAQRRRLLREAEERQRAEREALEAKNRKMLADYVAALEGVRSDRSDGAVDILDRERRALTLAYEVWSPAARDTALRIGFAELATRGVAGASEISRILDRVSSAAGLTEADARQVKQDLYETALWHLIATGRVGPTQETLISSLRTNLDIPGDAVAAMEPFRRLRDLNAASLPRIHCTLPLDFRESCVHQTGTADGPLVITTRRLALGARKPIEVELPQIDDITVDADEGRLLVRTDGRKKPLSTKAEDPVYTAAMIDLAGTLDARQWFA
jgi:hypothetical protein